MIRAARPALVVVMVVVIAASAMVGRAQSVTGAPDVLGALLTEVRGLRAVMEQMASAGPRVQLALGRLQIQEQRVAELSRKLDATRRELAENQTQLERHAQEVKEIEERLAGVVADPKDRAHLEGMLQQMKYTRQKFASETQRVQIDEAAQAQELANEQARWVQINVQLEELDRSLGRRQ